jgi:CheY-like chemotaxis protein
MQKQKAEDSKLITRHSLKETRRQLRILLAEDNAINREVAVRLLGKRGHVVTVTENGKEAVAALDAGPEQFDVVLMDVQMPEMDGFEATAAIRENEKSTGKHIPIIAMTAHAMKGDRERCLAAGMDAYVSKPVQFDELIQVTESFSETEVPAVETAERVWDIDVALSRVGGDQQLLADLAKIFCEQSPKLLSALETAIDQRNLQGLKRGAHSLRSAIATFAAEHASDVAAQLEESSRPEGFEEYRATFADLRTLVGELQRDLEQLAASEGSRPEESRASNFLAPARTGK